jgi:predicted  nucleic acid-binding Zn-ribbon protein
MLPDLQRLIRLQELDTETEQRRRWSAELPGVLSALDQRVAERQAALENARQLQIDNLNARRALEKDLSVVQGRLTKFKDQLMEVKTNKEYLAMQHEIATAQDGVRGFEDQILELLVEADELAAAVKEAEAALKQEQAAVAGERKQLDERQRRTDAELADLAAARAGVERETPSALVALFNTVSSRRHGTAVVEARDGHCSACHVRLRPQFYNELRRGDAVHQCESCSRILYVAPTAAAQA